MVSSTGTFVSCKDYDDDIDRIDKELSEVKETIASLDSAIKAGKFVQSCNEVTGGYELVFTDGSKITIKNGTNGADGTTVIPEFRVEGNYWQVSTDKGATWVDVKDTEGNKVPARGQDGEAAGSNVSWVTVDGVEYIKIGDKVTDLKQNNEFPNIAVDAESKTVIVTIDGCRKVLHSKGCRLWFTENRLLMIIVMFVRLMISIGRKMKEVLTRIRMFCLHLFLLMLHSRYIRVISH